MNDFKNALFILCQLAMRSLSLQKSINFEAAQISVM